jgi:hypothetical protein
VLERRYGLSPDEVQRYVQAAKDEKSDPTLEAVARELAGPVTGGADDGDAPVGG